jgi:hypothetical protein
MGKIVLYVLGVFVGLPLVWLITSRIGSNAETKPLAHLVRIVARCTALALAFAPTAVVAGYVGSPFPASLALVFWILSPGHDLKDRSTRDTVRWSIESLTVCLLFFLIIYSIISLIAQTRRRVAQAASATDNAPGKNLAPVSLLAAVSGVLFLVVVSFLIWLSQSSPQPGYEGP